MTSLKKGVQFALRPGAAPVQVSWTDPAYRNGWLVLDRNHNRTIDDLSELFGNVTPQPASEPENGFKALAAYDDPDNGGNGNGFIDAGDSVFSQLTVWIDQNHNGKSETGELHSLSELNITNISLQYKEVPKVDTFGNAFRYKARMTQASDQEKAVYDVYLQVQGIQ